MTNRVHLDILAGIIEKECLRSLGNQTPWQDCLTNPVYCQKVGQTIKVEFFCPSNRRYRVIVETNWDPTLGGYPTISSVDFLVWEPLYTQAIKCFFDYCLPGGGLLYLTPIKASLHLLDTELIALFKHLKKQPS